MAKTLCIDARLWGIKHTGIGRYTQNLISNLPTDPGISVVLVVAPDVAAEPEITKFKKYIAKYHPYTPLAQLEMLYILRKIKPQLVHFTHSAVTALWPGRYVVTVHDFIKHQSKGVITTTKSPLIYWPKYAGFLFVIWTSLRRAVHILVPSQYWKDFIIRNYHIIPDKITVTYEAADAGFYEPSSPASAPTIPRPYVIHTGSLYPHKNIGVLIQAIQLLKGRVHLALVCARSAFASRFPPSPYVHFLGLLSDPQLKSALKNAGAYVFPSLIEGFGLPGLEAMAVGTPVIAARASCLPEVYQDAALYFDPQDPVDLASKIRQVLSDSKLRQSLITSGRKQVKKYSWAETAKNTWQIYQKALH